MKKTLLITTLLISTFAAYAQKNTSQSYVEQFKDNAIAIMHETGIPASIILGIAIHESASGNSAIAKNLNNQFGFKGGGTTVYYKNNKKVKSAYKKYDSILDSFEDFARVITHRQEIGKISDKLTKYDYEKWVKGIQRSGYASSKKWASQVLSIIRRNDLDDLDQTPAPSAAQKTAEATITAQPTTPNLK